MRAVLTNKYILGQAWQRTADNPTFDFPGPGPLPAVGGKGALQASLVKTRWPSPSFPGRTTGSPSAVLGA